MQSLNREVTAAELRDAVADVVSRVAYGRERVGVTRHGKLTAVVIGVDDLVLLEELEMARDASELREAAAADDGTRVPLAELQAELDA